MTCVADGWARTRLVPIRRERSRHVVRAGARHYGGGDSAADGLHHARYSPGFHQQVTRIEVYDSVGAHERRSADSDVVHRVHRRGPRLLRNAGPKRGSQRGLITNRVYEHAIVLGPWEAELVE